MLRRLLTWLTGTIFGLTKTYGKRGAEHRVMAKRDEARLAALESRAFLFFVIRRVKRIEELCQQRFANLGFVPDCFDFLVDLRWMAERVLGLHETDDDRPYCAKRELTGSDHEFEMTVEDQWQAARMAYQVFDSGGRAKDDARSVIHRAVEVLEGHYAAYHEWDRTILVNQAMADLDALEAFETAHPDVLDTIHEDPFQQLTSDARGLERLESADVIAGAAPRPKASSPAGVKIRTPPTTGDPRVDNCFNLGDLRDILDTRIWWDDPKLVEAQELQMSADHEAALARMKKIKEDYADFDVIYLWMSQVLFDAGRAVDGNQLLVEGLSAARSKAPILAALGVHAIDEQDLEAAIHYLIKSAIVQLGGGQANTASAFLNLAALSEPFGNLDSVRDWLLEQADRIDNRRIRFNEQGQNERWTLATSQGNPWMVEAIQTLHDFYQ